MISRKYLLALGIFLTLFVGVASHFAGPNISLKLFYLLPIAFVTWYAGRTSGLFIVAVCLLIWQANLRLWNLHSLGLILWSSVERTLIFASVVFMLDYIRRHFHSRIHQAEERYTKIVESAIEGIIAVDKTNIIQFVNTPASALLGAAPTEILGKNISLFVRDESSRVQLMKRLDHPQLERRPFEIQMVTANASPRWALVDATPSVNNQTGNEECVLLLIDISNRKKTEEELQRRYEQISAMQRLSFGLAQSLHLDQRLQNALSVVLEVTTFDAGIIYLVDEVSNDLIIQFSHGLAPAFLEEVQHWKIGKGNTGKAAETGLPIFLDDAECDTLFDPKLRAMENIHGFATIPLVSKGRLLGVLSIIHRQPFVFSDELKLMLQTFGKQIGVALENATLYESAREREQELREMSHTMVRLQEDERKRFAREIHDGLSQVLTMLKINTELTLKSFDAEKEKALTYLQEVLTLANEAEAEAKHLANDLRPTILDDFGLKAAIKLHAANFERRTGITLDLHLPFYEARFDTMIETSLFRIVQELLANVAKHAKATKVTIQFLIRDGVLALIVADNGKGFLPHEQELHSENVHHGLRNMRERVEFFGGTLRVESAPHHGTEIMIEIPIRNDAVIPKAEQPGVSTMKHSIEM
ncbi:MAG: GAF domain-containing protein [Ignavibacteriae bacterium]|nr:GAF domain-containing protein [Ignavibacteriota bacterium]